MRKRYPARTARLRAIMRRHNLTSKQVAAILGRHACDIRAHACGLRPPTEATLRLLELELAVREKP